MAKCLMLIIFYEYIGEKYTSLRLLMITLPSFFAAAALIRAIVDENE